MLDFPASPTNGQLFTGANGVIYQWNAAGGLWLNYGVGMNNAIISSTPPANPVAGQLWWSPDLGQLFVSYNDGNSTQWVPASPNAALATQQGFRLLSRQTPSGVGFVELQNIPTDINEIEVHYHLVPVTNSQNCQVRFYDGTGTLDSATARYTFQVVIASNSQGPGTTPAAMGSTGAGYSAGMVVSYSNVGNQIYNGANNGIRGHFKIPDRKSVGRVALLGQSTYMMEDGVSTIFGSTWGDWVGPGPITGLRMFHSSGNIASGSFEVWGSP
jgi:hypothetical protein